MKTRIFLTILFCAVVATVTLRPVSALEKELSIGSKAPPLDIEHWIQDGNGFFEPVTKFEDGKVYVVEFWATWCGPCIASMPHLAELQSKYRGRGVQIVSVSDETLEEVNDLLARENEEVGKTFDEITSAYTLTTDPDRSVHKDYMEAAGEQGIPTSFIVGKTGKIEWIGHPMTMDEPLEAVVTDSWDREKFKEQRRKQEMAQENLQKVSQLFAAKEYDAALKLLEETTKMIDDEAMLAQLAPFAFNLKVYAGKFDEARKQLAGKKGEAFQVGQLAFQVYGATRQDVEVGSLVGDAIAAIEAEISAADPGLKPLLYDTVARLHEVDGNLDAAIKAQESAIEVAEDDRQKSRLQPRLEELRKKAAGGEAAEDDAAEK